MLAQRVDDVGKVFGRGRQVEQPIALGSRLLIDVLEQILQTRVTRIIVEVHRVIADLGDKRRQRGIVLVNSAARDDAVLHVWRKGSFERAPGDADHRDLLGQ